MSFDITSAAFPDIDRPEDISHQDQSATDVQQDHNGSEVLAEHVFFNALDVKDDRECNEAAEKTNQQ